MGQKIVELKMPTNYSDAELRSRIANKFRIKNFSFQIENKSLDARNKSDIHWLLKVFIQSEEIKELVPVTNETLSVPYKKRNEKVVVVGSGPAGFFSAYILQKAGFKVVLIERGSEVEHRGQMIEKFERTEEFDSNNNYAYGEGGAGTFSDGKLTSRSKHISIEKGFIINEYVDAGAPQEIKYLAHPHLGSDNLKLIVKNLREKFVKIGGKIVFNTCVTDLKIKKKKIYSVETSTGENYETDYLIMA
ncbi:MAG: FAD-dependent oxidoreductase, partial [Bacteroidetes bacterium HGW-Bacteroidetes-17]